MVLQDNYNFIKIKDVMVVNKVVVIYYDQAIIVLLVYLMVQDLLEIDLIINLVKLNY